MSLPDPTKSYVHVLLFACPDCKRPLVSAAQHALRSPEEIDLRVFPLTCFCGWTGSAEGLFARRHWVDDWD